MRSCLATWLLVGVLYGFLARAESALWPGGILDIPAERGDGWATVAYDAERARAFFWLMGDVPGGNGYLTLGPFVAGLLERNDQGNHTPAHARFVGTSSLEPRTDYRLMTSNTKVAPGALMPDPLFASAPFSLQGGRPVLSTVPEPGTLTLLLFGCLFLRRR